MLESIQRYINAYSFFDYLLLRDVLSGWKGKVLDVGSGYGRLKRFVPSANEYVGIDRNPKADFQVDIARERFPFDDASFDNVICNAVLEHVEDPSFVVREIHRVARPGAQCFFSIPLLQPFHPDPDDFRRFTHQGLESFLATHGFRTVRHLPNGGIFLSLEHLVFFEAIQFLKRPQRFLNPIRWLELLFLVPMYLWCKVANLFAPLFRNDDYMSPGVALIAERI